MYIYERPEKKSWLFSLLNDLLRLCISWAIELLMQSSLGCVAVFKTGLVRGSRLPVTGDFRFDAPATPFCEVEKKKASDYHLWCSCGVSDASLLRCE